MLLLYIHTYIYKIIYIYIFFFKKKKGGGIALARRKRGVWLRVPLEKQAYSSQLCPSNFAASKNVHMYIYSKRGSGSTGQGSPHSPLPPFLPLEQCVFIRLDSLPGQHAHGHKKCWECRPRGFEVLGLAVHCIALVLLLICSFRTSGKRKKGNMRPPLPPQPNLLFLFSFVTFKEEEKEKKISQSKVPNFKKSNQPRWIT